MLYTTTVKSLRSSLRDILGKNRDYGTKVSITPEAYKLLGVVLNQDPLTRGAYLDKMEEAVWNAWFYKRKRIRITTSKHPRGCSRGTAGFDTGWYWFLVGTDSAGTDVWVLRDPRSNEV